MKVNGLASVVETAVEKLVMTQSLMEGYMCRMLTTIK